MNRILFISDKIWPDDNSGIPIITYKKHLPKCNMK